MALAKAVGDDDVERLSELLACREAEDPFGSLVAEADDALRISIDDGVRGVVHQRPVEPVDLGLHRLASRSIIRSAASLIKSSCERKTHLRTDAGPSSHCSHCAGSMRPDRSPSTPSRHDVEVGEP
jgi:hypothetical protein